MENEKHITHRVHHPLAGVRSRPGPENPYRIAGPEAETLSNIRSVTSKLGFIVEQSALKILTGEIPKQTDNEVLITSLKGVRENLAPITKRTINTHAEISPYYQSLTEPPEIPFLGDERTWPSDDSLKNLFEGVDELFNTNFMRDFTQIGDLYGEIDPIIRYYVEGAEMLASLATEEVNTVDGQIIPNVWLAIRGKSITQFDGIIIPFDYNQAEKDKFDFVEFLSEKLPWGVIQIKTNFRARFITGKNKIKKPFARDESEFQQQQAKSALVCPDFHFPKFIHFLYCRGTNQTVSHIKILDRGYFSSWISVLEHNIVNGLLDLPLQDPALELQDILIEHHNSLPINKPIQFNSSTNGYVQGDFEEFQ